MIAFLADGQITSMAGSMDAAHPDWIALPPPQISPFSPNRQFVFVIQSGDNWQSARTLAPLSRVEACAGGVSGSRIQVWRPTLPHQDGPRYALLSPFGQVLLLEEWLNTNSPHAIDVIHGNPRTVPS